MHCLEVIVIRNAEAAGRELGHASNDKDFARFDAIENAHQAEPFRVKAPNAFHAAFERGIEEG